MRKDYLIALLLGVCGALQLSPSLAQSTQENQTAPPAQASPVQPSEASPEASPATPSTDEEPSPATEAPAAEGASEESSTPEDSAIDYSSLEAALQQQNWAMADEETYSLMLRIAGSTSQSQGYFDLSEWRAFPCEAFLRIDQLWSDASDGNLGFTAQNRVLQSVRENSTEYYRVIGWRQPSAGDWLVSLAYDTQSRRLNYVLGSQPNFEEPPAGHLPGRLGWSDGSDYRFEKVESCAATLPSQP